MTKQIFISLPVANIDRSMQFYNSLGFTINPEFTAGTMWVWYGATTFM